MQVQPYLSFEGRCEEAIEFYKKALGAKVEMIMRFKDAPQGSMPGECGPMLKEKIMHAALKIGDTTVMASDGRMQAKPAFQGIGISLDLKTKAEAERTFKALSEGRPGAAAPDGDFLLAGVRNGRRPLRRVVDGPRPRA